jgi:type I restriction enzyme S subunit
MQPPPIQIAEPDWREVRRVLSQEVPALEVWAFGSRARHTAKPYSDLDLALVTTAPLPLAQLASLTHAFESSDMVIRVDVVDWSTISEAFRQVIAADKVVVQHATPPIQA